jgi:hypothetical protein
MVVEIRRKVCDGHQLKWLLAAGVAWLGHHRERVNSLNVFPVPDGDTGNNMLLTVQKAYAQIADSEETHIGILSDQMARGALLGARGNSGTILSMLLRGFANGLKGRELMDAPLFAHACQTAVEYAYETVGSVMKPVEGTILTVAREAAVAVRESARQEIDLWVVLDQMIAAAKRALQHTPELLPRLKEAGVVDSGGMGLVYILEGMQRMLQGEPVTLETHEFSQNGHSAAVAQWKEALEPDDEEGYGYDVQFLMLGENMNVAEIRRAISAMGWSPLIDGDASLIKVHIHVHNPGEPLSYAVSLGVQLDDIVVENMQAQYLQYVQHREQRETAAPQKQVTGVAIIAVARGDGIAKVFEEYGATRLVEGGQTMNPGTEDFLAAIDSLHTREIIILPNNGNVILAAEEAAKMSHGKNVRVIHNKTILQGIAALMVYGTDPQATLDEVYEAMQERIHEVVSCEVTYATRTVTLDGVEVKEGELIGLVNGKLVAAAENMVALIQMLLQRAHAEDHELATLYYGAGVSTSAASALAQQLGALFPQLQFEVVAGGQPLYPYLISLE